MPTDLKKKSSCGNSNANCSWSCNRCTYHHESEEEQAFLVCAICANPKQEGQNGESSVFATNGSCRKRQKNKNLIVDYFASTSNSSNKLMDNSKYNAESMTTAAGCFRSSYGSGRSGNSTMDMPLTAATPTEVFQESLTARLLGAEPLHKKKRTGNSSGDGVSATSIYKTRNSKNVTNIAELLKPRPPSAFLQCTRFRLNSSSPWRDVTDDELPTLCPLTIMRDFLPKQIAATLLRELENDSIHWKRGNWIVHGKEHRVPRMTAVHNFQTKENNENADDDISGNPGKVYASATLSDSYGVIPKNSNTINDYDDDERYEGRENAIVVELRDALSTAASCVASAVKNCRNNKSRNKNQRSEHIIDLDQSKVVDNSSDNDSNDDWEPTFALVNRYNDGSECVGWHSDHIKTLGPRPIIVGLSLGACRRFEFREDIAPSSPRITQTDDEKKTYTIIRKPDKNSNTKVIRSIVGRHASVLLPHNSIVIMWGDSQESWQHSVPRCSNESIVKHQDSGLVRMSLTFRMKKKLPDLGNCSCGIPAALKAKQGKYYLFCCPYGEDKHETCNFWKPCLWAEKEAAKIRKRQS